MAAFDAVTGDAADVESRRLLWRCRRGMRELDALLVRYVERRWPDAEPGERAAFQRLLDCEDDRLWRWFLARERPDDPELQRLVERIVSLG